MQFSVSLSSDVPIYLQLATQIRRGVATGKLRVQDQLPSVRELSRHLAVNPNTIAKAYTELEREGVLHTRQGKGVFIAAPASQLTLDARKKRLVEKIDELLTDAVYLEFPKDKLLTLIEDRAHKFAFPHVNPS